MKKYTFLLATAALVMTMFTGCLKGGCNDPDAVNYDSSVKRDDGSCAFEGDVVVWYGESTADGLANAGITSLTLYVDDEIEGSSAASVYWTSAPDCGQSGTWSVNHKLGGNSSQLLNYQVKDQNNDVVWSGSLDFQANTCLAVKLTW